MSCVLGHHWGWPRRRGEQDVQVCLTCGTERSATVQFGNRDEELKSSEYSKHTGTEDALRRALRWFRPRG